MKKIKQLWGRLSPRTQDIVWHSGKAIICLVQLNLLLALGAETVELIRAEQAKDPGWGYALLFLALAMTVFIALWKYYDGIDDRSFEQFCLPDETPDLFKDTGWRAEMIVTVVGATPTLMIPLTQVIRYLLPALHPALWILIGTVLAAAIAVGVTWWRVSDVNYVWEVQKTLRRPNDKKKRLIARILYAIIYYISICVAFTALTMFVPVIIGLVMVVVFLMRIPALIVLGLLILWGILHVIKRIRERKKFLGRLERLRDRGELSFTVHGRPYLSLFSKRAHFSLTVTDEPHPDAKVKTPTTYRIAVANCGRKRMTVVLAEGNVYRFMYSFRLRSFSGFNMMSTQILTIPLSTWFINRTFEFPEGEGERILLMDPTPHILCMHGFREGELLPLDNASKLYGYTVYGKNAFVNVLERT